VESLARKYDSVENHGWYENLAPTVAELKQILRPQDLVIDYSGGTGILLDRLFRSVTDLNVACVIVDASPKFLRLALQKFEGDPRVAFRWLQYLNAEKRLQMLDEVLDASLLQRGVDVLCSTNAIHLYYDLGETLKSWHRVMKPGAQALVQSGNIRNPAAPAGTVVIDDTVQDLQLHAQRLVAQKSEYAIFRSALDNQPRMQRYDDLRKKYFLPIRPLSYYEQALTEAGFDKVAVRAERIEAHTADWFEFLSAYHEGVLGWAGGVEKIDGQVPTAETIKLRVRLLQHALTELFQGSKTFDACWTYLTYCVPAKE